MALINCPECKSVLFDIHCQNCGHHVVNKFFLPEGFYFIGDPIAVFTDIKQWVLVENAKLNCITSGNIHLPPEERKIWYENLLEKVDLNELEFWYQLEKKLACCFYAELNGTEVWSAKIFRAIEYENPILGDGWVTTNMERYKMLATYSGRMSIIPTSMETKMEFRRRWRNGNYFYSAGEWLFVTANNPVTVTFHEPLGTYRFEGLEFGTLEIYTKSRK